MFTGIVTDIGTIKSVARTGDLRITIATAYDTATISLGASIACSGVCLTVVDLGPSTGEHWFAVDVSGETENRTASRMWTEGKRLNLERALKVGDELGGHIVTGHVDGVGRITASEEVGGSRHITLVAPNDLAPYLAAKGSVTLDGVSLTVNAVEDIPEGAAIHLNIIPHTQAVTALSDWAEGAEVNIEIDVLARYLKRMKEVVGA